MRSLSFSLNSPTYLPTYLPAYLPTYPIPIALSSPQRNDIGRSSSHSRRSARGRYSFAASFSLRRFVAARRIERIKRPFLSPLLRLSHDQYLALSRSHPLYGHSLAP